MFKQDLELHNTLFNLAIRDNEVYNNVISNGGIDSFFNKLLNGVGPPLPSIDEIQMLKDAISVIEASNRDKDIEIATLLKKYNELLADRKKANGLTSISDLEKEYECMTDIHGYIAGPVNIPQNIPGEMPIDSEVAVRGKENIKINDLQHSATVCGVPIDIK
jgi:hypothetical protein